MTASFVGIVFLLQPNGGLRVVTDENKHEYVAPLLVEATSNSRLSFVLYSTHIYGLLLYISRAAGMFASKFYMSSWSSGIHSFGRSCKAFVRFSPYPPRCFLVILDTFWLIVLAGGHVATASAGSYCLQKTCRRGVQNPSSGFLPVLISFVKAIDSVCCLAFSPFWLHCVSVVLVARIHPSCSNKRSSSSARSCRIALWHSLSTRTHLFVCLLSSAKLLPCPIF